MQRNCGQASTRGLNSTKDIDANTCESYAVLCLILVAAMREAMEMWHLVSSHSRVIKFAQRTQIADHTEPAHRSCSYT